jgi:hypothetical protein
VLISRCAWHPRNYGHGKLLGLASWRGLRIQFTDGICPKCAARVRSRWSTDAGPAPGAPGGGRTSEIVVVALAVLTALVLIAQPANEGSAPVEVAELLPRALTVVQVSPVPPPPASPARGRPPQTLRRPTIDERREPPVRERLQSP